MSPGYWREMSLISVDYSQFEPRAGGRRVVEEGAGTAEVGGGSIICR